MSALPPTILVPAQRPFGVTILILINAIFLGIIPILNGIGMLLQSAFDWLDLISVFISLLLGSMILRASIGAWRRLEPARRQLIKAVNLTMVFQILLVVVVSLIFGINELSLAIVLGVTARCLIWLSINRWYFRKPQVVAWYTQAD